MDISFKVLLVIVFSISAAAKPEQKSTKENPVKAGSLLLDYNWPRMKTGLTRFPHPSSCQHFYSPDSEGQFKLRKCPAGLSFDFITLKCGRATLSQCWSSQFDKGYKPLHHRKHFHCPVPWGRYPDILNCKKFFQCHGRKVLYKTCPSLTLFDKTKGRCVAETLAICSDAAEIEKYYKCPRSRGLFLYSKDCSKYHECRKRISKLRSCKLDHLFDATSQKCRPQSEVTCGHRYNPYDKTTSGSNIQPLTTTQGVQTRKPQTSNTTVSKTSEFVTAFPKEFHNDSLENSSEEVVTAFPKEFHNDSLEIFETSSEELSESTENIVADDFSQENNFGITDSGISNSLKQLLIATIKTAHESSFQDFKTGTAETTRENSPQNFSVGTTDVVHESSSHDFSTGAAKTAPESSSQYFSSGKTEATHESSYQDFSTGTDKTNHESSFPDFSTRTASIAPESSPHDFSTGTAKTAHESSFQDFSRTPETAPKNSSQDLSTEISETAHASKSQEFITKPVEKLPENSSQDLSTEISETAHESKSQEFITKPVEKLPEKSSQNFSTRTDEITH